VDRLRRIVIPPRRPRLNVGEAALVIGGAALLAASWVMVAITEHVPSWEARAFEAVNGLPAGLWPVMWIPMQLGSFVGSLVVVGATAVVSRNTRLTLAALLASQTAFWAAKGIKRLARRGRPGALLGDVQLREHAGGLGYISGHAAVACALAAVLLPSLPSRWQPVVAVLAVTVGVARLYAGVHLPLDVLGGCGFGLLCGTFARWSFGLGGEGLPPRSGVEA
jgi:membrane-associated phospholipid phosphatase